MPDSGAARPNVYNPSRPVSETDLALMCRIGAQQLAHPFAGSRMRRDLLRAEGYYADWVQARRHAEVRDGAAGILSPP
jgi:hypothetical protein